MDPTDPTWFRSFAERVRQRQSLPSVQQWVSAHDQPPPPVATKSATSTSGALSVAAHRHFLRHSARNDVRTVAVASGSGVDLTFPPSSSSVNDYNIFANIALHDQAAATIVSASQRKSGFTASMLADDGTALGSFTFYILDFVAPHWDLTHDNMERLTHEPSNHPKFVNDVLRVVEDGMRTVGASNDDVRKAQETVRSLAERVSSNSNREEKLTLFSNFWMQRLNATDPVFYGIFYMTLTGRYVQNGKTEVLSVSTNAHTYIFKLNSAVLIANERTYNALHKSSVEDWLAGHTI